MNIHQMVTLLEKDVIQFRRHLHMYPELSKEEFNTSIYIKSILDKHQIPYETGANTGVVAYINKHSSGRCVALRADTDALPITEMNDVSYKSQNEGVMHACGHDAHTAILLGVAIILNEIKDQFDGCVKLFFQPDEEVSSGARRLVNEGFMQNPKVDFVLGLHVMPHITTGTIEMRDGPLNASSGTVEIEVLGKSAHAAYPHLGIDSIVVASNIVMNLQTLVTRHLDPMKQAVLSFGTIEGGVKTNIISEKVIIKGTLRTLTTKTRNQLINRIEEICEHTAKAYGASANCVFSEGYPPLINDNRINRHIRTNAETMPDINTILIKKHPSMGAEDFGYYQEDAIGAFYHLGCKRPSDENPSGLHTPTFDIDESCLKIGVELQIRNTLSLITNGI